jgi:hypothetical protein
MKNTLLPCLSKEPPGRQMVSISEERTIRPAWAFKEWIHDQRFPGKRDKFKESWEDLPYSAIASRIRQEKVSI